MLAFYKISEGDVVMLVGNNAINCNIRLGGSLRSQPNVKKTTNENIALNCINDAGLRQDSRFRYVKVWNGSPRIRAK